VFPRGATDRRQPHDLDELYYVIRGHATLAIGENEFNVGAGSIACVEAGVEHRLHTITEHLEVLVLSSTCKR
jgi:mannose-1-phosphate guanylyltransferase